MQFLITVGIFLGMTLIPATRALVTPYPTSNGERRNYPILLDPFEGYFYTNLL